MKKFISNQFGKWYAERVRHHLTYGKPPGDVKVSRKLSDLKPLYAKRVVEMYEYFKLQKESVIKGFKKAGITEAVKSALDVYTLHKTRKPF